MYSIMYSKDPNIRKPEKNGCRQWNCGRQSISGKFVTTALCASITCPEIKAWVEYWTGDQASNVQIAQRASKSGLEIKWLKHGQL
jgi:hypothetical protein